MKFNTNKFILGQDFIYKNNKIHLTETGKAKITKFKKLTGSRLGAVFGDDNFKSPFKLWCEMLGFYEETPNNFFLEAGRVIEPKLKAYAEQKMDKKFKSYDPLQIKFDLFPENPIFGGIPDGEEFDSNGNLISILEIKTAQLDKYQWRFQDNQFVLNMPEGKPIIKTVGGGLVKWFKNGYVMIPENYKYQLSLYLYLRNITQGYFCVAFVKAQDYCNPDAMNFNSEFNNYEGYDIDTDKKLGMDGHILLWQEFKISIPEFQKKIDYATDWYHNHIIGGISPELTTEDLTWFRYGYPSLR